MFSIVVGYKYTICDCTLQWGILPILIRCRSKIWMNFNFFFIHMGEAFLGVGGQESGGRGQYAGVGGHISLHEIPSMRPSLALSAGFFAKNASTFLLSAPMFNLSASVLTS